jgi:transposase
VDYARVVATYFLRQNGLMRTAITISLNRTERATLRRWAEGSGRRLAQRARIVLFAAEGRQNNQIAAELGTDPQTVGRWRIRFASERLAGIQKEAPRSGRKRRMRESVTAKILRMTARHRSRGRRWSARTLAKALGVNHMLVYRVWRDHNLVP